MPPLNISNTTSSPYNATSGTNIYGYFNNIAKSLNVSPSLVFFGFILVIALIMLLSFIIYVLRKKKENERKYWKRRKEIKQIIFDDDFPLFEAPYGYIDMTIMYIRRLRKFKIQNLCLCKLPGLENDIPDCYIKIFLRNKAGKKIDKRKTATINDNINPKFPEVFTFRIEELTDCIIYFQVCDENKNGNDIPIGDGNLILNNIPRESYIGNVFHVISILHAPEDLVGCGEVCIVLTYYAPKLKINILEAKDLLFIYTQKLRNNINQYPSVYATVKVFIKKRKMKIFTTRTLSNTTNPYIFETFSLTINIRDMFVCVIKVEFFETIFGKLPRRIGRSCIGNPLFNELINQKGKQHLDLVCKNFKTPHAMWHCLVKG